MSLLTDWKKKKKKKKVYHTGKIKTLTLYPPEVEKRVERGSGARRQFSTPAVFRMFRRQFSIQGFVCARRQKKKISTYGEQKRN